MTMEREQRKMWGRFGLALLDPTGGEAYSRRFEKPVQATYAVMAETLGKLSRQYGEGRAIAVLGEMEEMVKDARVDGNTTTELARRHGISDEYLGLLVQYGEICKLHLQMTMDVKKEE